MEPIEEPRDFPSWHNLLVFLVVIMSATFSFSPFPLLYDNFFLFSLFLLLSFVLYVIGIARPGALKMRQTRGMLIGGLVCFTASRAGMTVLFTMNQQYPDIVFYLLFVFITIHLVSYAFVVLPNEILEVKSQHYLDAFGSIHTKIGFLVYLSLHFPFMWIPYNEEAFYLFSLFFTFSSLFITCVVIRADSFLITRFTRYKKEVIGEYRVDQKVFPINLFSIEPK